MTQCEFKPRFWLGPAVVAHPRLRRIAAFAVVAVAAVSLGLAVGASEATAAVVVGAAPTWPVPADAPAGPPQIQAPPASGATPPRADQIADPVTPSASCGGWQLQGNYGNRWPGGSSWWEYRCADEQSSGGGSNCTGGGACQAFCPSCWEQIVDRTDYFYWDGSEPVFYGEYYSYFFQYTQTGDPPSETTAWWDADTPTAGSPAAQWYWLGPFPLKWSTAGAGDGGFGWSPDAGFACDSGCLGSFDAGTVVTLTATPGPGSVFAGWSGDCSGTGSCQLTMDGARSVTATFVPGSFAMTVSKQGTGSGQVSSSPVGIGCGSGCQAGFDAGTVVSLSATPDAGSVFAGWSGDCSGTGSCQVTMSQARSVTATLAPDLPPHASFMLTCIGLNCTFDGGGSSDPDDGIASYAWNFGDGSSPVSGSTVSTVSHTYAKAGSYTVTLTATDHAGASAASSKAFNPISVSARGYKRNGAPKVDLSWNGASGTSFDVYRNGTTIASSLKAVSYADTVTGAGSFIYRVCASATSVCSNPATVSF
jgi:PKD repeat protein